MSDRSLARSVNLLNSLLIFVVATFMIEAVFARSVYLGQLGLAFVVAIPVKLYCYAGIYGYLVELLSGREMVISYGRFHQNALRYLRLYLGVSLVLYVLNFLSYAMIPSFRVMTPYQYFYPLFGTLIAFFLAHRIISDKYLTPDKISARIVDVSWPQFLVILGLFLLECALSWLPAFLPATEFDWARPIMLLVKYISLLQFSYITAIILDAYQDIFQTKESPSEIFLINPCAGGVVDGVAYVFQSGYPPVFVVLKALTPKHYKFREFNRIFWRDRYYKSGKLVAITCYTSNCAEAYKIAKEFKKRGSKVVMGGPHVTYLPDEALEFCDSVVIGEAEAVWKDVIRDYENNTLEPKYMGNAIDDYHAQVHQELLKSPPHIIKDFLETTRGCKFRCHFCTIPSLSGGKTRKKPVTEIVELIGKIKHKYRSVIFLDNNIYSDPAYAKELFQALIPLKIKWWTQCTIDIAKNTETLALAKKSGCAGFLFGYEIFGGSLEKQQGGKFAMAENYFRYTKIIKKMGIKIKAHFIFGFDSDSLWNLPKLWWFCVRIWPLWTVISILSPLPGSALYYEMLDQNRIMNLNWRNIGTTSMVIRHPRMNSRVASFLFPFIRSFFFLTTSSGGVAILAAVTAVIVYDLFWK